MHGKLGDSVSLDLVCLSSLFRLLHCGVPFALGFCFGFLCLFSGFVLDAFLFVGGGGSDELNDLAGARRHESMNQEMFPISKNELIEFDIDSARRSKFSV